MTPRRAGLPRHTCRSLTVIAAAAVLAGCARGGHGSVGGAPTTPAGTSTTPAATSSAPAATPASPPLTPRSTANRNALKACKSGRCEVKVTHGAEIPVDARRFKVGTIRVGSIEDHQVSLTIALPTAENRFDCQSDEGCDSSVVGGTGESPGTGYVTAHAGAVITVNRLVIQVVSVANGSAVLRLKQA
ncbi:hypothetical protein [Actinoallomurus vinaceus]|uniref:hypothetical protein n=1 Tax=Actinoallomurus vinaceus TaxID=1080074 RepID=UPI0031ECEB9C